MTRSVARAPGWTGVVLGGWLLLWASGSAQAQPVDTPPAPGAPRPLGIKTPVEQRLSNGLRVIVAQRPGVQLITARLVVLSGSEVDPPAREGLATMTAAMLSKGTTRHSASALAQAAESLGGGLDSGAGWHQSEVSITVTVPEIAAALALVSEAIEHPRFSKVELDRLRTQALDDLKVTYTQPGGLAALAAQRLAFGSSAYAHPGSGTPASLRRISRTDLVRLHKAVYRPDNSVLILSGDVDAQTGLQLARSHFGSWTAPHRAFQNVEVPVPAEPAASTTVIDMPGSGQAAVILLEPMAPLGAERAIAAVTNAVLGGGYSSRLNLEIRVRRGLSYSAGSQIEARRSASALRVSVQTKNETAAEVVALVHATLDRLGQAPADPEELSARKASLIGEVSRGIETTGGLAGAVQTLLVQQRPMSDLATRIEALAAVTASDVQHFASSRLDASHRVVVIAGEYSHFDKALLNIAPESHVIRVGEFSPDSEGPRVGP